MEKSEAFIILKGITRASSLEDVEKEELINIIDVLEKKEAINNGSEDERCRNYEI